MYGLPLSREYDMNDRYDVFSVIENFNNCPLSKRYILASNIKKAFNEFNINKPVEVLESNEILKFLDKGYVYVEESFEPDKALVWLDKPIEKLFNRTISIYHGTEIKNKGKILNNNTIAVGATKFSEPRWVKYYWDNFDYAAKWALMCLFDTAHIPAYFNGQDNKLVLVKDDGVSDDEIIKYYEKHYKNINAYVYEAKIKVNDLEIGSSPVIKEYTISKPIPYYKCHILKLNKNTITKYCEFEVKGKLAEKYGNFNIRERDRKRGPILNKILSDYRDRSRKYIFNDIKDENGNVDYNADISIYKKSVAEYDKEYRRLAKIQESININEFTVDEKKRELMEEIDDLFGITVGNSIVKESYEEYISSQDKLDLFFNKNELTEIMNQLKRMKQKYGIDTKLSDIDYFRLKKNLSDNNDSVYFPSNKTILGDFVYVNDNLYLMSKKETSVNEFFLIPLDKFWDNKGKKIIIEETENGSSIEDFLNKMS